MMVILSDKVVLSARKLMQELCGREHLHPSDTEVQTWLQDNAAELLEEHISLLQSRHELDKENETTLQEWPATIQEYLHFLNVVDVCWTTETLRNVRSELGQCATT